MLREILTFVYPKLCISCERELRADEGWVCLHCENDFSPTNYKKNEENPVFQLFWGKVNIEYASACFDFIKGENLQQLIHEFKYKGKIQLAPFFGKIMANYIQNSKNYEGIDAILFVPSSKEKIRKRGYNQAEELAKSIAKELQLPVINSLLIKSKNRQSQTTKTVLERYQNMENTFEIKEKGKTGIHYQHFLLVDDVITTGATVESCASALKKIMKVKVSVLALAYRNI